MKMGEGHNQFKIPNGQICPALQITNSEIGMGSLSIVGGYLDHGCTNLLWSFKERGLKKVHIGGRLDIGDSLYKLLSDETKNATDQAVWLQFRDAIQAALSPESFDDLVATLTETAQNKIEGDVIKVVDVTAKKFALTDTDKGSVLKFLIEGGDLSQFGLANAVTSLANTQDDYDRASELEVLGGKIIELPKTEWRMLATAS